MLITTLLLTLGAVVPNHPKDLVFPEYVFSPPTAEMFREQLSNGVPIFIVEDRELPLINIVATFRGGSYLDPVDRVGLCSMMASLVRGGGTTTISAEALDERFAFLAANTSVRGGFTTVTASLNCLSSNFEESFSLFIDMLQHPRFQESRLQLEKDDLVENMKQRNDFPSGILRREFSSQLFGDSYLGRQPVVASTQTVTSLELRNIHAAIINPANLILSISGDFDRDEMLQRLERALSSWDGGTAVREPSEVISKFEPGVYYVDQDVSQGGVRIGLRSLRRGDPDAEAAKIMNYILGGGGFSSRITQKVRSDEGLAYSARSSFTEGVWGDGRWSAGFESKSQTVALAAKLVFDEINRIRTEVVSDKELDHAKMALIERFPSAFQSKARTLAVFVNDELTSRDTSYWTTYCDKISRVTAQDVLQIAQRLLRPEDMVVVIVGDWDEIKNGDAGGRATMEDIQSFFKSGVTELPLRDPLTLEIPND